MTVAVRMCNTCGATPCVNPMFCAVCRAADRRRAQGQTTSQPALTRGAEIVSVRDISELPLNEWSDEEVFLHLKGTFDAAARAHPDVLEPYITILVETDDLTEQQKIMRDGLRSTFKQRFPGSE